VLCTAFLHLLFGFVFFWRKNIGAKVACEMLMKLKPGYYKLDDKAFKFNQYRAVFNGQVYY